MAVRRAVMAGLALVLGPPLAAAADAAYVALEGDGMAQGRALWLESCEGCHGYGIAGAPIPMEPAAWAPRLAKGQETLYRHAIEGFFGPDDTMMPARGGNPALTDPEVKAAVDYMTGLARHYIQMKENTP